ncbi:uncharacterized protein LOC119391673 [Rhipicephalus sanguineus]|uniref:GST C-terminal domain-containing protein n=1 Tax=Rhipicephalus sanguineus TaxID=34632 RepID=A0A9D4Q005_RHISA|nr:uncharacterized protein LOC119391673 [Rhipicephalus sanguineus]KAH7957498.1 hypothetical protein HPB52_019393 [Rhipicephalus sanguineus]
MGGVVQRPRIYQKTKPTMQEITTLEDNYVRCLELLIGDDKFSAGDSFSIADIAVTAHLPMALESFVDPAKFPKLASYYERVKREQLYFEEIYRPALNVIKEMKASLK